MNAARRVLLGGLVGSCLALLGYALGVGPHQLEVTRHSLRSSASVPAIRIAQLSDLHLHGMGRHEANIAAQLQRIQADLIVLSGDVIDRSDALPVLDQFLGTLGPAHKVAVLGNWEYWSDVDLLALRALYERHAVRLLINERTVYTVGSRVLHVAGVDDFTAGQPDARLLLPPAGAETRLLVQHSPGWFDTTDALQPLAQLDLCLSGHTHGGQVALFGKPVWTPRGSGRFSAGFYQTRHCKLYVSRGLGTSILPIRFGATAEIAVFDL